VNGEDFFTQAGEELAAMRVRQALELYQSAEAAKYDSDQCAAGRWNCHMLAGEFELAWRESDTIARRGQPDPHRFWDGHPLAGRRVLLRCLHGLGDTLQFVRYAPFIRRTARSLTIEAQPKLKALLEQAHIADHVITWGEPEPAWDQQVEVMELPQIFRTTVDSIPDKVPYIDVEMDGSAYEKGRGEALCVGIAWASSRYNPARSIPIESMASLFNTPGVSFFSLQAGIEGADVQPWAAQVVIPPDDLTGILDTAKRIKRLDLVISVDTMTAHLAGAMGQPVWTLLPYECDWRWMLERVDSPWYPTMRLFRQRQLGDWHPVIQDVQRELMALAARPYWDRRSGAVHCPTILGRTILAPER
jgi:hypothetical protein